MTSDIISLSNVTAAHDVLRNCVAAVARNNSRAALDVLEASAVSFIVRSIDQLASIQPLGSAVAYLFSPITNVLNDLAGNPSAIYAHCDALLGESATVHELPSGVTASIQQSQHQWNGSVGSDAFRTLATFYASLYSALGEALAAMASVTNQIAVTVVKTKVAMVNLVVQLLWDVIDIAFKVITQPWNLVGIVRSVITTVLRALQQLRTWANTLSVEGNGLLGHQAGIARAMDRAGELLCGGNTNAGTSGSGFTESMRHDGPHPDDDLMSDIIGALNNQTVLPEGWERVSDEELARMGIDMGELNGDGFGGAIVRGPDGQLVVQFDGTDFSYMPDVVEDGIGGLTMSPQSARAIQVAEALRRAGHADNVVYTGTSLGGRLAAVAALSQGQVAVTFNAAGVSPGTMAYLAAQRGMSVEELHAQADAGSVRCYVLDGEILTTLQEDIPVSEAIMPDAPGQRYVVPNTTDTQGMNPVEKHIAHPEVADAMREHWEHMNN